MTTIVAYRLTPVFDHETWPSSDITCLATGVNLGRHIKDDYLSVEYVDSLRGKSVVDQFAKTFDSLIDDTALRGAGGIDQPRAWANPPWNQRWTISMALRGGSLAAIYEAGTGFMFWKPLSEEEEDEGADPFGGLPVAIIQEPVEAARWLVDNLVADEDKRRA